MLAREACMAVRIGVASADRVVYLGAERSRRRNAATEFDGLHRLQRITACASTPSSRSSQLAKVPFPLARRERRLRRRLRLSLRCATRDLPRPSFAIRPLGRRSLAESLLCRAARQFLPGRVSLQLGTADADDVACDFDVEESKQELGKGSGGNPSGRLACRCTLEHIACVGKSYLSAPARSAWPGRGDATACALQDRLLRQAGPQPVLPVAVCSIDGDWRADGLAVPHPGEDVGGIGSRCAMRPPRP